MSQDDVPHRVSISEVIREVKEPAPGTAHFQESQDNQQTIRNAQIAKEIVAQIRQSSESQQKSS